MQKLSRRAFLKRSLIGVCSLIPLTAGYSFGLEPRWIEVSEQKIFLSKLSPKWNGIRIVVFGDLHVGFHMNTDDVQHIVNQISKCNPDLLIFTGDLVDESQNVLNPPLLTHFKKLDAPLGKYAVLGNHDYQADLVTPFLRKSGFVVLNNKHAVIQRNNASLVIAGIEDMLQGNPDLYQALEGAPDTCKILLSHCPDFADQIIGNQVDLQISGHSHGGQIRFPFLGALITPPGGQRYTDGYYHLEKRKSLCK